MNEKPDLTSGFYFVFLHFFNLLLTLYYCINKGVDE